MAGGNIAKRYELRPYAGKQEDGVSKYFSGIAAALRRRPFSTFTSDEISFSTTARNSPAQILRASISFNGYC